MRVRKTKDAWSVRIPVRVRAMVIAARRGSLPSRDGALWPEIKALNRRRIGRFAEVPQRRARAKEPVVVGEHFLDGLLAKDKLFLAGPPDVIPEDDPTAAFEGRLGGDLWALSATDGKTLAKLERLAAPPVYDGLIAANRALYLSTTDGKVHCFGAK